MFKMEFVVTKCTKPCDMDNADVSVIAKAPTIIAALTALITELMSQDVIRGIVESPYDELSRYEIEDLTYEIEGNIYMISEVVNDDFGMFPGVVI